MNTLHVTKIRREGASRLCYDYRVEGEWKKYFRLAPWNRMWVEYDEDISSVPNSAAVLPLIGNVIVLASLMDATIYVDEIDRDFYECVEYIINGFETIMPKHVRFKKAGLIEANAIVSPALSKGISEANLLFFSGGVDATSSLISHLDEKPLLVNIWGADVAWYQEEPWKIAEGFNRRVAERYGLRLASIRTNMRACLSEELLNNFSLPLVNDYWWPAFHHSISMMLLAAPLTHYRRKKLYFASTYSSKDHKSWGNYVLASDPLIDNNVYFCGCQVVHDGYEFSRHDKIRRICRFYESQNEKPFLRVCYHSNEGTNCGHCRKCSSTILSILLEDGDPNSYGFSYKKEHLGANFAAGLREMIDLGTYTYLSLYNDLQLAYQRKYSLSEIPLEMRVFYETEPEVLASFLTAQEDIGNHFQKSNSVLVDLLHKVLLFYRRFQKERFAAIRHWLYH